MLGGNGAVWRATQAIANDAVRPSPAGQMSKLLTDESSAQPTMVDRRKLRALIVNGSVNLRRVDRWICCIAFSFKVFINAGLSHNIA